MDCKLVATDVVFSGPDYAGGTAPDFSRPLRAIEVNEKETAVFECQVTGEPAPSIKWFKDGKEISQTDNKGNLQIETIGEGVHRLTIRSAANTDAGLIKCEWSIVDFFCIDCLTILHSIILFIVGEAANEFGVVWSDATLTVKGTLYCCTS